MGRAVLPAEALQLVGVKREFGSLCLVCRHYREHLLPLSLLSSRPGSLLRPALSPLCSKKS